MLESSKSYLRIILVLTSLVTLIPASGIRRWHCTFMATRSGISYTIDGGTSPMDNTTQVNLPEGLDGLQSLVQAATPAPGPSSADQNASVNAAPPPNVRPPADVNALGNPLPHNAAFSLPKFQGKDIRSYFKLAESIYEVRQIVNPILKYHYLLQAMSPEQIGELRDIWPTTITNSTYDEVKQRLISAFTPSLEARAHALIHMQIGDRLPSALVSDAIRLLGDDDPMFVIIHLILAQLPEHIRADIKRAEIKDLYQIGKMADSLVNVSTPKVQAVIQPSHLFANPLGRCR